jgi:hypothetical protein
MCESNIFDNLDILEEILSHVQDAKELLKLKQINRQFNDTINCSHHVWRDFTVDDRNLIDGFHKLPDFVQCTDKCKNMVKFLRSVRILRNQGFDWIKNLRIDIGGENIDKYSEIWLSILKELDKME